MFSIIPLEIIVETSYYQSVYPISKHVVGSFVGRFCLDRNIILPVPFEAAEVMINVQSIERTFVDKVIDMVRDDRTQSKNNPSAQLEYIIPDMLMEIIRSRFYEHDYKNVTQKLLYEDISYDHAIENGIAIVAESDVFVYKK